MRLFNTQQSFTFYISVKISNTISSLTMSNYLISKEIPDIEVRSLCYLCSTKFIEKNIFNFAESVGA